MNDVTEIMRRGMVNEINNQVKSDDPESERKRLEEKHGQVWDTQELVNDFAVEGFMAPFVAVRRLSDNKKGLLSFQHNPRFYFAFSEV